MNFLLFFGTSELPTCRRFMYWAHVIRNIRKNRTHIKSNEKFLMVEYPFQTYFTIDTDLDLKAYDCNNRVDRNEILQLDGFTFVALIKEPRINTRSWVHYFYRMNWLSYDHFK